MATKRRKKTLAKKQDNFTNITNNIEIDIDYDKLAEAIVKANKTIIDKETEDKINEKDAWHKLIGYKEYNNKIKEFFNSLFCVVKIFTFPKKYVRDNDIRNTQILFSLFLSLVFEIIEGTLFIISLIGFLSIFYSKFDIITRILVGVLSIGILMFSRVFRIAKYEIDKFKDRDGIFMIFSAVVSFIAMIFCIIAVFK